MRSPNFLVKDRGKRKKNKGKAIPPRTGSRSCRTGRLADPSYGGKHGSPVHHSSRNRPAAFGIARMPAPSGPFHCRPDIYSRTSHRSTDKRSPACRTDPTRSVPSAPLRASCCRCSGRTRASTNQGEGGISVFWAGRTSALRLFGRGRLMDSDTAETETSVPVGRLWGSARAAANIVEV